MRASADSSAPRLDDHRLAKALAGLRPYTRRKVISRAVCRLREIDPGIDGKFQASSPVYPLLAGYYGLDPGRQLAVQMTEGWQYWVLRHVFTEEYRALLADWAYVEGMLNAVDAASYGGGA